MIITITRSCCANATRIRRINCQWSQKRRLDEFKMASHDGLDVHVCLFFWFCPGTNFMESDPGHGSRSSQCTMATVDLARSRPVPCGHGCCDRYQCVWTYTRKNGRCQQRWVDSAGSAGRNHLCSTWGTAGHEHKLWKPKQF